MLYTESARGRHRVALDRCIGPRGLQTDSGSITDQPGHLINFMATFIDLAGAVYGERIGDRRIDPLQGRQTDPP